MSRLSGRVARLCKKGRIFVTRDKIRSMARMMKMELERVEKLPDLERRVNGIAKLFEENKSNPSPETDEKLRNALENDDQARLTFTLRFWGRLADSITVGFWYDESTGQKILQSAERAERFIKREAENEAARLRKEAKQAISSTAADPSFDREQDQDQHT